MLSLLAKGLGRLSVGRKLLLIFLLDMTAVAFISGILVNEKYLSIDFARKELVGNAYISALRPAMIQAARGVAVPLEAAVVAAAVQDARTAESRQGAGLDSRQASSLFAADLDRLAATPADAAQARTALEQGHKLLGRIGNQSNLILDPDLDSYYTMSIVVLRIPELLASIASATDHIVRRQGEPQSPYLLLEGRLDASREALESDYSEAIAASTPALKRALEGSRNRLSEALQHYRQALRAGAAAGAGAPEAAAVAAAHQALLSAVDLAWKDADLELDRLLQVRIHGFFERMWLHLGTALGLLACILSAVFFVARQIAIPLKQLSLVTDTVRRTGDHSVRARWDSHDEIGRLVLGFNDMLAQLDRERAVQQELAASARAAQAQQQLVEAIPIPLVVTAIPGHQILHANNPARAWLGQESGDPWRRGLEPAVRARFFQQLADRDEVNEFEVHWNAGGEASWAVLSARRLDFQGQNAVLTAFAPINHLKSMERRLELWAKVFEASGEGIVIVDAARRVLSVNRAFCRSTLYEPHEVVGEALGCLEDSAGQPDTLDGLFKLAEQRSTWQGELLIRRRDGSSYPAWVMLSVVREGQQGQVSHTILTTLDITNRKQSEARIQFLAQHDVLTELPNRLTCAERLQLAILHAERSGTRLAVLFIDLDRFKNINDSLGHHVGDGLLRSMADRLLGVVRRIDIVSRLGGDEFIVVLNEVAGVEEIGALIERRMIPAVRMPHEVDGSCLQVSCSIGVAVYPEDGTEVDVLMRHADVAMYHAKSEGRDRVHFFTAEMNERVQLRLQLESELRNAAVRAELTLDYQPRVDARSGQVLGVEALLRWHSPVLGELAPDRFIPVAEETGMMVEIGAWVIDAACRQHAEWLSQDLGIPQMSINVSALQLRDGSLVGTVNAALERYALLPGAIELELTESALMDNIDQNLAQLNAIKRLGVELAIDDFGTGYSSLNYLNRFPIDRLKIDRSFIRDMLEDPTHLAITRAIISLGHTLGLKVVAEGVETEREAHTLRAAGCDELQGFLLARPMAGAELASWSRNRRLRGLAKREDAARS